MLMRLLLAAAFALWLAPASASAQQDRDIVAVRQVMTRTIGEVIRPGYSAFRDQTKTLAGSIDTLCAAPSAENLNKARTAFKQTVTAWAGIEFVRFGPVMAEYRLERVLFWPDRKSAGLKQVQAALAGKDATATDPETLKGKSVALQGLGALEYVLFGTGAGKLEAEAGYRCDYAKAVAASLMTIAGELVAAWDDPSGISAYWTDDRAHDRVTGTLNQLVATLVHGLEDIRDARLRPFVGDKDTPAKPKLAIFWRSDMTIALLRADIDGLAHFFDDSQMQRLLPDDQASIADSVRFEFREAAGLLQPDDRPIATIMADEKARDRLVLLDTIITSLINRIDGQYAPSAGLAAGFSFSDGD